jgi:hypothetical protein
MSQNLFKCYKEKRDSNGRQFSKFLCKYNAVHYMILTSVKVYF